MTGGPSAPQERTVRRSSYQRNKSLDKNRVRGVDRPPAWAGPSACHLSIPPETKHVSGHFQNVWRTVRAPGADRPPLGSQLKLLTPFSNLFEISLALMHASRHFEQNDTKDPSSTSTRPLLMVRLSIQQIRSFVIH